MAARAMDPRCNSKARRRWIARIGLLAAGLPGLAALAAAAVEAPAVRAVEVATNV